MTVEGQALELLGRLTGDPDAAFRAGQLEAIEQLVERRGRVLVVERTGWGKSAVYFIATRLLRDRGSGPTVLISPLLALMRNQLLMAERGGVQAATIHSGNRDEWKAVEAEIAAGRVDLLLISPERLNNDRFRAEVLPELAKSVGLLVVDEAHCISDWGHDFRPDYRRIARVLQLLPRGVPLLCTTATANDRVVEDIQGQLGTDLETIRGPLDRESLVLGALDLPEQAMRLAWLATVIPALAGSGIVYCLTVADTDRVAGWLRSQGIDARACSGASDNEDRVAIEDALLANSLEVVVATSALGMGFDKPDLAFVIHYQSPGSPIAYYQQVGRAGRAMDRAVGVLLHGHEDVDIQNYFVSSAFPPQGQAEQLVALLEARAEPMGIAGIESEVNARRTRLLAMLKVLEVEGAVERVDGGWRSTLAPWTYDAERVERVTAVRRAEQRAMAEYVQTPECRMVFVRSQLDDPTVEPCGRCDNCTGQRWEVELDRKLVAAAALHLRTTELPIEPRLQWPVGLDEPRGRIAPERQLQFGRCLSVYNDGGWGGLVRRAKHDREKYADELVAAAADLVRRWGPEPRPEWITCIPSTSSRELVPDFARRLGLALELEFRDVVRRVRANPPQNEMENSAQQCRNTYGAFEVAMPVPNAPVLLIDDIVDSRWTLTCVGDALLAAGSGPAFPFVLARALSD
ncbi:MAG: RecQ family ATP-dependent DNA helicase [Acidimicrobiia bacterium]